MATDSQVTPVSLKPTPLDNEVTPLSLTSAVSKRIVCTGTDDGFLAKRGVVGAPIEENFLFTQQGLFDAILRRIISDF